MAYGFKQAITIDHTKCGTANTSNYPLLLNSTLAGLKTVANGGNVQSASGLDIAFYSDSALATQLSHEVESWSASTGAIIAWVKIPTLTFAADLTIYIAYGDAAIVTSQQNVTGTWESTFKGVYHFGTGGGNYTTAERADSTSNANTLSNGAAFAPTATGIVGDAFNPGSNFTQCLLGGNAASLQQVAAWTIEGWIKPANRTNYNVIASKGDTANRSYNIYLVQTTGVAVASFSQSGAFRNATGTTAVPTGSFSYIVGTYDGATLRLYVNGAQDASLGSLSGSADNPAFQLDLGAISNDNTNISSGPIDEVRVSSVARSSSYVTATYNNVNAPSSFYAIGAANAVFPTSTTQRFTLSML